MHHKILIITHTADNEAVDTVISAITAAGGEAVRFDVDLYPDATALTTSFDGSAWKLYLNEIPLDDVTAVWYRRSYHIGKNLPELMDKEYLPAAMGELRRTLFGMLESLPCFQIERYSKYRRLDSKEEQLRAAEACGLLVPATCITNDPLRLQAFIRAIGKPVIAKMQSAFAIDRAGTEHVVFTNEVTAEHLDQLPELRYCPMMFQEKLEKALELRITIVGRRIFAFSIDSQQLPDAQVDWRKEGASLAEHWQPYTLPHETAQRLLALMDYYMLNYGAIDMILTPSGEYYFLELNAAGEYYWLDKKCGHAISLHLAEVLTGQAGRR